MEHVHDGSDASILMCPTSYTDSVIFGLFPFRTSARTALQPNYPFCCCHFQQGFSCFVLKLKFYLTGEFS